MTNLLRLVGSDGCDAVGRLGDEGVDRGRRRRGQPPEEARDGDVGAEDPGDADDERHGGHHVRRKGEDDEEQRAHDAHHLRCRRGQSDY